MDFIVKRHSGADIERLKPCSEALPTEKKGCWKLEIKSLDELCELVKKYNCVIISENKEQFLLTICDPY